MAPTIVGSAGAKNVNILLIVDMIFNDVIPFEIKKVSNTFFFIKPTIILV